MSFHIKDGELRRYRHEKKDYRKDHDGRKYLPVPAEVTSIGTFAFSDCSRIPRIRISQAVKIIGRYAFYPCENLEAIEVDPRNPWFSSIDGCLYDKSGKILLCCPAQKEAVHLSRKVRKIEPGAFAGCHQLQSLTVSAWNFCFTIVNRCLYACNFKQLQELIRCPVDLEEIHIPLSVSAIYAHAFECCSQLRHIRIPDKIQEIAGYTFRDCINLESVELPKQLQSIGDHGFYCCESLREIEIPPGTKTLLASAFGFCKNLERLVIPCSVTHVGYIVSGCHNLESVSCHRIELHQESYSPEEWTDICSCMNGVLWMIVQHDFKERLFEPLRTLLIFRMAQHEPEGSRTWKYLQEHSVAEFANLITENQLTFFQENREFFRKILHPENIDLVIRKAIDAGKHEFYLELLNFKNDFLGFSESPEFSEFSELSEIPEKFEL